MSSLKTGDELAWSDRPITRDPKKLAGIAIISAIAFLAGILMFHQFVMGLLGVAVILFSTAEFWLGTSFRLTQESAQARTGVSPTEIRWENVKRVELGNTIQLSPFEQPGRLDAFRGVKLRVSEENRAEVEAFIRARCSEGTRFLGAGTDA